jgi:predicted 3-demethylubiquinone-9 3-methyltransferase (glyoxalase superfamily)
MKMAKKKRDAEIDAIAKCQRLLANLPDDGARDRAVAWLADKYMGVRLWDHVRSSPAPTTEEG